MLTLFAALLLLLQQGIHRSVRARAACHCAHRQPGELYFQPPLQACTYLQAGRQHEQCAAVPLQYAGFLATRPAHICQVPYKYFSHFSINGPPLPCPQVNPDRKNKSEGISPSACPTQNVFSDCNKSSQGIWWQDFPLKDEQSPQASSLLRHVPLWHSHEYSPILHVHSRTQCSGRRQFGARGIGI